MNQRPSGYEPDELPTAPLRVNKIILGAEDRNRTGTNITIRRILSPVRLPIPPLRRGSEGGIRTHNLPVNSRVLHL